MVQAAWPTIRGIAMRFTKLDACGAVVTGPKSQIVSDGFISVGFSPQYEDGEETRQKNAAGRVCIKDKAPDELVRVDNDIALCGVNPDIWNFVTAQPIVLDYDGDAAGIRLGSSRVRSNFALELWQDIAGAECEDGLTPYAYYLLPFLSGGKVGDFTIEETAANFNLTTSTKEGSAWGVGPYDVVLDGAAGAGVPSPLLEPIIKTDHLHMQLTYVPPPTVPAEARAVALTP